MKVKWEQFAQRRKINLEMFRTMPYDEYVKWCSHRRVEPLSKETYESVANFLQLPPDNEGPVVTISTHVFDEKQLKKMRKTGLEKLCKEYSLDVDIKDTKKSLIAKLIALNNQEE